MTLASTTTKVSYAGDGSTSAFPVPFKFLLSADVRAILRAANGAEAVWVLDTDYSLSGAGNDAGGTLTASVAPASGETLVIKRAAAETQQTDVPTAGPFASTAVETALDLLTMLVQQVVEALGRVPQLAETSATSGPTLPEPEADTILGWNAGGTDLENKTSVGGVTDHGALSGLADDDHSQYHTDARALDWLDTTTAERTTSKGAVNGYASLDGGGKIPSAQLPASVVGALNFKGTWNAATNTPSLSSGLGDQGDYYRVSAAGSTSIDGIAEWAVGDHVVFDGTAWDKIDNTDQVTSVHGRQGAVSAQSGDYTAEQISETASAKIMTSAERTKLSALPDAGQIGGVNTQTGTSYTLVLADKGKLVEMDNAGANTLTVPPNSSVGYAINTVIHVTQLGAGQTTIAEGTGVNVRSRTTLKMAGQYATVALRKRATNEWVVSGDLATS